jgi:hypothetical protein
MNPNFWGNSAWLYLHTLSFNYPDNPTAKDKKKYLNFFNNLGDMLPCPSCAKSYNIYIKFLPVNDFLDDIHGITYWLYTIHYLVNIKLNKKNISFLNVVKKYYPQKSNCLPIEVINTNEKCTADPNKSNSSLYTEFVNITKSKYKNKIMDQLSKLNNHLK